MIARARTESDYFDAAELGTELNEVLRGQEPAAALFALSGVIALQLVKIPPEQRPDARLMVLEMIDEMVPGMIGELIREGRAPPDWLTGATPS